MTRLRRVVEILRERLAIKLAPWVVYQDIVDDYDAYRERVR